jgi:hypothetical protein
MPATQKRSSRLDRSRADKSGLLAAPILLLAPCSTVPTKISLKAALLVAYTCKKQKRRRSSLEPQEVVTTDSLSRAAFKLGDRWCNMADV